MADDRGLYIVADGVGSRPAASIASRLAVNRITTAFVGSRAAEQALLPIDEALRKAVQVANTALLEHGESDQGKEGMAAVVSALALSLSDSCVAHVGDTRVYLLRCDEHMKLLTVDHTSARLLTDPKLSNRALETHPLRRHLVRALGLSHHVDVDIQRLRVQSRDRFLLCSDGLTDVVDDSEIEEALRGGSETSAIVVQLLSLARRANATDDVTVVVVDVVA